MTVFKNPQERRTWIDVRCLAIGQRFVAECARTGFDPKWVKFECGVELHRIPAFPHLASLLRADWLSMAGHHGMDVQFVLAGTPAAQRVARAEEEIAYRRPAIAKGAGGKDEWNHWVAAHRRGIGERLRDECARLKLDLAPIEYLCTVDAVVLMATPGEAGSIRIDFLSLLAERGVDVGLALVGPKTPKTADSGVAP